MRFLAVVVKRGSSSICSRRSRWRRVCAWYVITGGVAGVPRRGVAETTSLINFCRGGDTTDDGYLDGTSHEQNPANLLAP